MVGLCVGDWVMGLHTRSDSCDGACTSHCNMVHTVIGEHTRFEIGVAAADWYWELKSQFETVTQMRSEVMVGACDSYSESRSHRLTNKHSRSLVAVGATD